MENKLSALPREIQYYLQKYGMTSWVLYPQIAEKYKLAIVIPVIKEYNNIIKLIKSISNNHTEILKKTIFIFVVNSIENSNQDIIEDNVRTISYLKEIFTEEKTRLNIAYVDANSKKMQLPLKDGGVGLARKIGIDLALTIFDYDNEKNKNIILWLDADCIVSENYINKVWSFFNNTNFSAGFVKFQHLLPDNEQEKLAIICYEIFLRYYVLGLMTAKSPYAFHTIGSTLACDVESYIKIQGMNKKKAGEDFYFMEKLAKITKIGKIQNACVYPSSRPSWRVPFGTGRSVSKFLQNTRNEYLLYSPKSFYVLKEWLEIFNSQQEVDFINAAEKIHPALKNFLVENNFQRDWERILKHSKSIEQLNKQKRLWFDGFRTLKLIHYLRDNAFPQVNMFDAVVELLNKNDIEYKVLKTFPTFEEQLGLLILLRNIA